MSHQPSPEIVIDRPSPLQKIAATTVVTKIVKSSQHPLAKPPPNNSLSNGHLELLTYLHEQSVSETTHPHGKV